MDEHSKQSSRMERERSSTQIKGPWTREEDEKLKMLVKAFGPKRWTYIAKKLGGRIGKQCRERWHNHLDPNIIKTPFTVEEDNLILALHSKYGNKWSDIAKYLPGRTDNAIKNHWNSSMQKRNYRYSRRSNSISGDFVVPQREGMIFIQEDPSADIYRRKRMSSVYVCSENDDFLLKILANSAYNELTKTKQMYYNEERDARKRWNIPLQTIQNINAEKKKNLSEEEEVMTGLVLLSLEKSGE